MTAGPQTLTSEHWDEIRDDLLRKLARLERSLTSNGQASRPRDLEQDTVGRLSRIEALQNQGLVNDLAVREKQQLAQIMEALRRIEDGSYGSCVGCGSGIPYERLLVFPETQACCTCVVAG